MYVYLGYLNSPIGADGGVVSSLIVVHFVLTLCNEPVLCAVGPDAADSQDGLLKVGVDWGAGGGLQSLQLTRSGHIEPLQNKISI